MNSLRPAVILLALLTLLTGVAYPLGITVAAQVFWPKRADGSLELRSGEIVGSKWIGQNFDHPQYFWGRPSATRPEPYDAQASSGSNLSPFGEAFQSLAAARLRVWRNSDPGNANLVPVELITASASGLDPHISPQGAYYQANRVARARGLSISQVQNLIGSQTEPPTWGFLGQPRVNVLMLNLALDETSSEAGSTSPGGQ